MTDYGSMAYWDERYSSEDTTFDWYQEFSSLKPYLMHHLTNGEHFEILVPGCGNSSKLINSALYYVIYDNNLYSVLYFLALSADLYEAGYHNITNIDTSAVVIQQMNERYAENEDMECK